MTGKTYLTGMSAQTKLSAKGQVVIPKNVREKLGLVEGTVFDVVVGGNEVILRKSKPGLATSAEEAVAQAVRDIRAVYRYDGPPVSLKDMKRAIEGEVVKKFRGR